MTASEYGTSDRSGRMQRSVYFSGRSAYGAQRKLIFEIGCFRLCPFCDLRIASLIGRPDRSFSRIRPNKGADSDISYLAELSKVAAYGGSP